MSAAVNRNTVPNAPLRERCQWLLEHDPEFTLAEVCRKLADEGQTGFINSRPRHNRRIAWSDTSRLQRVLGMQPWTTRPGQNPGTTTHINYDLAVALCRALDLDYHKGGV